MKPIFSRNTDIDKIAFLNWRIEEDSDIRNILNLADGFLLSSIELAKLCITDNKNKRADILIFPIFNNANHGIELYLKAITWILNKIIDSDFRIEGKHNIKQIFEVLESKVKSYKGRLSLKDFKDATKELWSYITELFDKLNATHKNDKMDFSRYPFSINYENHFYVSSSINIEIDLENFIYQFEIIKQNLINLSDFLYYTELQNDL